jgi:hypothetical protein
MPDELTKQQTKELASQHFHARLDDVVNELKRIAKALDYTNTNVFEVKKGLDNVERAIDYGLAALLPK